MSEEKEKVLKIALKALLFAAQELCVDVDELVETAFQSMLNDKAYDAKDVAQASSLIEAAADALPVIH
ncbi:hypothetical protein [Pseudomonas sp. Ps21-P2]|uniref:hypothetical protein n=1 Tax=Pseudomonas sp. Ps21-P2 TaxID=3080331 RepID=UPI00320A4780